MMESNDIDSALDRAVTFLKGGVQRPGMEQALRVIETWEQRLAASEHAELVPIAENLADLRVPLLAGEFDPAAVGRLLITLGEQVESVATKDVGTPVADKLSPLSGMLIEQGDALISIHERVNGSEY